MSEQTPAGQRPPVVVSLHVEGFGEGVMRQQRVERDKWDAMTPAERSELLDEYAENFATNYVTYGWHIDDPADYTAATDAVEDEP